MSTEDPCMSAGLNTDAQEQAELTSMKYVISINCRSKKVKESLDREYLEYAISKNDLNKLTIKSIPNQLWKKILYQTNMFLCYFKFKIIYMKFK